MVGVVSHCPQVEVTSVPLAAEASAGGRQGKCATGVILLAATPHQAKKYSLVHSFIHPFIQNQSFINCSL